MKITNSPIALPKQKKNATIVFFRDNQPLLPEGKDELNELIRDCLALSAFKGKAGQTALFPTHGRIGAKQLIVAGTGDEKSFHPGRLEQAAAAAVRAGKAAGIKSFAVSATTPFKEITDSDYLLLTGRGASWGCYTASAHKTTAQQNPEMSLVFAGSVKNLSAIQAAEAHGNTLCAVADLANAPGNISTPEHIAKWTQTMAKKQGITCTIMGEAELKKKGCGGILAVSQGSAHSARMIILKHAGTNPQAKPVVLVGKTLTFDSGGISLKPGKDMGWMRYDKCGGMAVLAAMQIIAQMKPETPVIGILGVAENMPDAHAIRPGDIITAYKGKTIEVLNTDAEGRLVLVDAIGLAVDFKPQAIIDVATLTGAVIMALGSAAAAVLGNNQPLVQALIDAGTRSGERLWQLPLFSEYTEEMQSDFADLCNISKTPGAGTATAAAFLNEFVPETIPWAHLDIAGTAWTTGSKPHQGPGATLYGARLLAQWVDSLSKSE